jgi:ABC-type branched-subunit amino acid transport system ATPase component
MSLQSFKIENQKAIVLVEATAVPRVMVIAGPNGIGKSTLLYAIKQGAGVITPDTQLLYQGPHRVIRKTSIQRRWLGGPMRWISDLLLQNEVSGFEGLNFQNPARTPENVDEAGSTLKHTLGRLENRRQAILASLVDRASKKPDAVIDTSTLPDVYAPLRKLTEFLLPHLMFDRVDFNNEDNIQCLWKRSDSAGSQELDIDDMSSGEKAVIVLFFPLLEDQIRERLQQLEALTKTEAMPELQSPDRVMLIDEPEQHLHPDLQAKILSYIRRLASDESIQFVITTHSPTILDQAYDDKLYAMSAPSGVANENQLRRIATNVERLETLKELAGSAYFLTTGRVIVCVEGEGVADSSGPTDAALLEALYPRATAFTLVPTRGRGNVLNTVGRLREHMPENTFRIRVRGLVDADQGGPAIAGVEVLPVSMIENLLLDPMALSSYLGSVGVDPVPDAATVEAELREIALLERGEEIALRVARRLKAHTVRIKGATVAAVKAAHAIELAEVGKAIPPDDELARLVTEVTGDVDQIVAAHEELARFRGKNIIKAFYGRHVSSRNIGYKTFCFDLARIVAKNGRVAVLLDPVFERLQA